MKFKHFAAALFFNFCTGAALAQSPAVPAPPAPPAPAEPPVVVTPPTPPAPPAAPAPTVVEGTLAGSQRLSNDRGQFQWICSYRVSGAKRAVQLDESCPATMPFQIKR